MCGAGFAQFSSAGAAGRFGTGTWIVRRARLMPFLRSSSIALSSARSALIALGRPRFPSWHSYGRITPPSSGVSGSDIVNGLRVRHWIVHRELILDDISRHALEPLGDHHFVAVAQPVAVAADARLVREVRGHDDELVTFPSRARVTQILSDALTDVRASIGVDDPRVVDHLVAERHHARRLHDTVAVAVDDAKDGADDAARDAAIVEREVLGRIEGTLTERTAIARGTALLGFLRDCWHDAVWRIDDERRLPERATGEVVAERADVRFTALHALLDLLDASSECFITEIEVVAEILGALARDTAGVVTAPDTLKIGIPHGVFGTVYGIGAPPL